MNSENDWDVARATRTGGLSAVHVALLFGSAAVALALIVGPLMEGAFRPQLAGSFPSGIDTMSTGSIANSGVYTIRRSVLQSSPNAVCIIRNGAAQAGDC